MPFAFDKSAGRLSMDNGAGLTQWRSDAPPAFLLPDSYTITLTGHTIAFPDLVKNNYAYWAYGEKSSGGLTFYDSQAWSFASVVPGEYNANGSGAYNLARELVGAVPAGCNYLDVRATFTQTAAPSSFLWQPVENWVPEGVQTWGVGQGFIMEVTKGWRRGITFEVEDGDVYLNRHASVYSGSGIMGISGGPGGIKTGTQTWTGGGYGDWANKWTHGGVHDAWLAHVIDSTGSGGDVNKARGGPGAPSFHDTTDYSSSWTADIEIRPGYAPS